MRQKFHRYKTVKFLRAHSVAIVLAVGNSYDTHPGAERLRPARRLIVLRTLSYLRDTCWRDSSSGACSVPVMKWAMSAFSCLADAWFRYAMCPLS